MTEVPVSVMLLIGLATGGATLAGGILIFYLRSALDLILGFSAGAIIGVALFDLLPEGLDLAGDTHSSLAVTTAVAGGFAFYFGADRTWAILTEGKAGRRHFAPASLTLHSFVDGLAIGLAYHVSPPAGLVVMIGVLAHDFIDGGNTVAVSLSSGTTAPVARLWLGADAAAPLAGILVAGAIAIPSYSLAILLGIFGGFFLYMGASNLLPRSQARRPRLSTIAATAAGLAVIYLVISIAKIDATGFA